MGSLRRQSLLMTTLVLLACMVIGIAISHYVIEKSMRDFERRDAEHTLERIDTLLNLQLINMRKQAKDYAVWNTTYQYMANGNTDYITENYSAEIFGNLDIDYAILLRTDDSIALTLHKAVEENKNGIGLETTLNGMAVALSDRIKNERLCNAEPFIASMLSLNGQLYLYSCSKILTNDGKGPARGTVIFVRTMNKQRIDNLKALVQAQFELVAAVPNGIVIDADYIHSTKTLLDTRGKTIATIKVNQLRPLKQQITTTKKIINANALSLAVIALLSVFFMFDRLVLRKVDSLVKNISSIRKIGAIGQRLPAIGDQDIDRISSEVNYMLEDLSDSHRRLHHDAFHDHLTGLGNRKLLLQELEAACHAVKTGHVERFAMLLMDLDAFKDINDLHGHLAGDYVIMTIADRLREYTDTSHTAIRLGGDEFAVIIRNFQLPTPEPHAARVLEIITQPIDWDGYVLKVQASIGIVVVDHAEQADAKPIELLRKADIAMYACKNKTKNGFMLFHADIERTLSERKRLELDLSAMIAAESSEIWMQPILHRNGGKLFAMEALSRWIHPEFGEIPPNVFIAIAEETALIARFDRSIIRRCCHILPKLRSEFPDLRICINVAALTLLEDGIIDFIASALRDAGLPENSLMLEITETMLTTDESSLIANIQAIRDLGVQFLIDDFGTGYSSLSRLNALPLDFVKIDRSFLGTLEISGNPICNAIIQLAHSLDMQVIAEGVETAVQHQRLAELNCDFVQGFHYARPMNIDQLADYLKEV